MHVLMYLRSTTLPNVIKVGRTNSEWLKEHANKPCFAIMFVNNYQMEQYLIGVLENEYLLGYGNRGDNTTNVRLFDKLL